MEPEGYTVWMGVSAGWNVPREAVSQWRSQRGFLFVFTTNFHHIIPYMVKIGCEYTQETSLATPLVS